MRNQEIIDFVNDLKTTYQTNDPYEIAELYGISVHERTECLKGFTASAVKFKGYAPYILINANYSERSRKVMCAHELGHIFLHDDTLNNFTNPGGRINMEAEYEANLFALALLEDQNNLAMDMAEIPAYLVQTIVEKSVDKPSEGNL